MSTNAMGVWMSLLKLFTQNYHFSVTDAFAKLYTHSVQSEIASQFPPPIENHEDSVLTYFFQDVTFLDQARF
jgi:hypothetical protein